jgi:hypothetical protein
MDLPEYFFRVRENGAAVFRIDAENRQQRLEMDQIAVLNIRNGEIKPQGERVLSAADRAAITAWMEARRALLAARDLDDIHRTVDHLNLTAQWAQSKASAQELDAVTDALLLAMHDLRTVLVRKRADKMAQD